MKKIAIILLAAVAFFASCKEDEETGGDENTLKFMQGQFAGTTYHFEPNIAFWAETGPITKSIRLLFGQTASEPQGGAGTGDIYFYYSEGKKNIAFPSPEGQYMRFTLSTSSGVVTFQEKDVNMVVDEFSDDFIRGTISGTMCSNCASDSTSTIFLEFKVNTQKQK